MRCYKSRSTAAFLHLFALSLSQIMPDIPVLPSEIKNKDIRSKIFQKQKLEKAKKKSEKRKQRAKEEQKNPELKEVSPEVSKM